MTKEIVILGGLGDGLVIQQTILDIANKDGSVKLLGYLNDHLDIGSPIGDSVVLGKISDWGTLDHDVFFIAALHKVKAMPARVAKINGLNIPEQRWTNVIHPTACVSQHVKMGHGIFLGQNAVVQPGSVIGNHVTVRAGASLGHDSILEQFSYVGPNATLCGKAILEEAAHLAPNAVVLDGKKLGKYSVVGIGSAVTKDTLPFAIYFGVPAQKIGNLT